MKKKIRKPSDVCYGNHHGALLAVESKDGEVMFEGTWMMPKLAKKIAAAMIKHADYQIKMKARP